MLQKLIPALLNASISPEALGFTETSELLKENKAHGWTAQANAKKAAYFGLNAHQQGFNLLVLGEHGTGRTSLMLSAMRETSLSRAQDAQFKSYDLVALFNFEANEKPLFLKIPAGYGTQLRVAMDNFVRQLAKQLSSSLLETSVLPKQELKEDENAESIKSDGKAKQKFLDSVSNFVDHCIASTQVQLDLSTNERSGLENYFRLLKVDVLDYLGNWQPHQASDSENVLESLLNESFLGRYRVNVLVNNGTKETISAPVIYDNDPSMQSLFGGVESATESSATPDFMRLRAGNLLRADGGILMLHLRDILEDQQNGSQILEKLHRFLRNGTLQIEDLSGSTTQTNTFANASTALPVCVKLVLIATRDDFYQTLEEKSDFFNYFPIKVEFAERIEANAENYAAIAGFIAQKCQQFKSLHFTAEAVAFLINDMQRLEEDQNRISTNFATLERWILESVSMANKTAKLVTAKNVKDAKKARQARHHYVEAQIRDSIIDNELMIQVHGEVVGQVNGLTHIELGDASFGSPVRITARCYAGSKGVINIDREVEMSGPNHDKGIFILQSWLSASFSSLAPLSLNASLVFEQEYNGVEGDSASCAELFALLSALSGLPVKQGIAVTGALNQFGEVMPIGGVNEKIEGYFRVCKALGLDGTQGVMIPKRNQRHLMLDDEVVEAVKDGKFHIMTMDHVVDGISHLTGKPVGVVDEAGNYAPPTLMGGVQQALSGYRNILESNKLNS